MAFFMHASGPFSAKHHDAWMLCRSRIQETLDEKIGLQHRLHMYGDPAYGGCFPWVVSAGRNGHINMHIHKMNHRMARHHISVEWGYGLVSK